MSKRRDIVIEGSGVRGAMAAAYLGRMLPSAHYRVIYSRSKTNPRDDMLYASLHADIRPFHKLLKINEAEFIKRCDGVFSLGETHKVNGSPDFINTFCPYGLSVEGISFLSAMQKLGQTGSLQSWEPYNLPARMIRDAKFLPPDSKGRPVISDYSYGYQIDPSLYAELLQSQAERFGVIFATKESIKDLGLKPFLTIDTLDIADQDEGETCAIPSASFFDFKTDILNETKLRNHVVHEIEDGSLTTYLSCQSKTIKLAFSLNAQKQDTADNVSPFAWRNNVISFGQCSSWLPFLGAPARFHQIALEKLISLFPGSEEMDAERAEYNQVMQRILSRFLDIQNLSLNTGTKAEHTPAFSEDLTYKIRLFKARGRMAMNEDDNLFQDNWMSLFLGQNIWPKGINPMAQASSDTQIQTFLSELNHVIEQALSNMPSTKDFISRVCSTNLNSAEKVEKDILNVQ